MTGGGSDETDRIAQRLGDLLARDDRTIGVAESLTGGLVVQALARQRGSGDWLMGGVVAYQRAVKHELLEVRASKVVSSEAAAAMATSVRHRLSADVGLSVTGVAGPDRQDGEPPGTVWMAVDLGAGPVTELVELDLDGPEEICDAAVVAAISLAARELDRARS